MGGGSFVAPEQVGPYPLIGIDEAVERLRENYLGSGGSVGEGFQLRSLRRLRKLLQIPLLRWRQTTLSQG